jgi:3-hydroxy-9,10-secoandrosta-1,3,5(10)-triene-9,17-dione monooxygenase reductase component
MNTYPNIDPLELRRALGRFGTGVAIVSTRAEDDRPVGVTVNSFNSVSLAPPIVLWSLSKASSSLQAFDTAGRFVIQVLAVDQVGLSRRFSSRVPDKFDGVPHRHGLGGLPVIEGCTAAFECLTVERLAVGDHILFLGRVESFHQCQGTSLLYCQGRYAQGVSLEAGAA